jgi:hypothetical protein
MDIIGMKFKKISPERAKKVLAATVPGAEEHLQQILDGKLISLVRRGGRLSHWRETDGIDAD